MKTLPKRYAPCELAGMTNSAVLRDIGHWIQDDIDPTHEVRRELFILAEKAEKIDKMEGLKLDNALGRLVHIDFHVQSVQAATKHALTSPEVNGLLRSVDILAKYLAEFGIPVPLEVQEAMNAYNRKRTEVGL